MKAWTISMISKVKQAFPLFIIALIFAGCNEDYTVTAYKDLSHYPSGSALEFKKGKFYLVGDDASYLLILDEDFTPIDSIAITTHTAQRIPKNIKPDLESMTFSFGSPHQLLALGSGSVSPARDSMKILNTRSKAIHAVSLNNFWQRLKRAGIAEINIEGMASLPWGTILSNRGHQGNRKNHLIFTSKEFFLEQEEAPLKLLPAGVATDSSELFAGISGICYSGKSDRLILTLSTEATSSTYKDGAIGKSYLWIIDDISTKQRFNGINPNREIDLTKIDKRFKGQKIESVCIIDETNKMLLLGLTADNDDGQTVLFKLRVEK